MSYHNFVEKENTDTEYGSAKDTLSSDKSGQEEVLTTTATRVTRNARINVPGLPKSRRQQNYGALQTVIPTLSDFGLLVLSPEDYEQYPEDHCGEEMGHSARFYKVYLSEAGRYNAEIVEGWKDNLDVLLVFVSIFVLRYLY